MKKISVPDYHFRQKPDGTWEKEPGRIKFSLHLKSESNADKMAKNIVTNQNLSAAQREHVANRLAKFIHSYEKLRNYVHTPLGDVDICKENDTELGSLWHGYLFTGRELIDEIGWKIHYCLKLKEPLGGLDAQKFNSLEAILNRAIRKRGDIRPLLTMIKGCQKDLGEFIALRNREKIHNDTLIQPPTISASGVPSGGLIVNKDNKKDYIFAEYLASSFSAILGFVRIVLGENNLST